MALNPDGLCVYETTKQAAYNISVSLILISFFMILNFLNKKESKVICKREFEIILLQTQSLSIKPFYSKRQFNFIKNTSDFKTFCEAFVVEFYLKLRLILRIIIYMTKLLQSDWLIGMQLFHLLYSF